MPHLYRFYIPPETESLNTGEISLPLDEAHHALHVVRLRPGDETAVFDGAGRIWNARVARTDRHNVVLTLTDEIRTPPPRKRIVLIQGMLHRDKSVESLIQRCTELGVTEFRFFVADHSERMHRHPEKWPRIAIEACKQCGRTWLPRFEVFEGLTLALVDAPSPMLIATRDLPAASLRSALADDPAGVSMLIGPEGDFSQEELACMRRMNAQAISLGDAVYRSEAAAALLSSLVLYELGEIGLK